jgi:hypothetical protein
MSFEERSLDCFRQFQHDPVGFGDHVLGVRPWSRYREFLRAVRDHDRVAIRAGQKVSKTAGLAVLSLWWVCTRPKGKVIFGLPSSLQGQTGVYAEILRMHDEARYDLGGEPHLKAEGGIVWTPERRIFGFSAADTHKTDKFLGHSGPDMLFLLDEAPGIPDHIVRALGGNLAGGGKMVLSGNPTRTHGEFYNAFHSGAAYWHGLRVSSEESPNVTGEVNIKGLALRSYIEEKRREWGERSWDFIVKITGQFCAQDELAFISLELVEQAQARWSEEPADEDLAQPLSVGVDPARMGKDKSVIVARRGNWAERPVVHAKHDNVQLAAAVLDVIQERARPGEYVRCKIDQTNNNGVADVLKRAEPANGVRIGIVEVMSQDASLDPNFVDRRAEVYGSLKGWLKLGAIPPSSELQAQLTDIKSDVDARLRVRLESKRDIVARLGRSPDDADALALSTYERAPDTSTTGSGWERPIIVRMAGRP